MQKLISLLAIAVSLSTQAEDLSLVELRDALVSSKEAFEVVAMKGKKGKPITFAIELGKDSAAAGGGEYDGFRFTVPKDSAGTDFIWYFNAPSEWENWYLIPVEGEVGMSFRNWHGADQIYRNFDKPAEARRTRILQSLTGDYFKPGGEYIIWFRKVREGGDSDLRGIAAFKKSEESWDLEKIEKALGLKPSPVADQVSHLKSRGGLILLDTRFFDSGYGENRISTALTGIRATHQSKDGFFITMKTSIPSCVTTPSLTEIIKEHGEPDFVRNHSELKIAGRDHDQDGDEQRLVSYHYDYFSFDVVDGEKKPVVLRVDTHGSDFSVLRPQGEDATYASLNLENLMVFHRAGKEVGRAYFFMEGGKKPHFVTEPPVGEYRQGNEVLIARGGGEWSWESKSEDGKLLRRLPMKNHRLDGKAEGFHSNGKPSFVAHYHEGRLHGDAIQYDETGKIVSQHVFVDGEVQDGE